MRLRVKIKNAKECRIELNFPDLSVKYNNGFAPSLKVAEGTEIPLDVLDPEDIRKSMKVGSLRGYLDNGWIEEFVEEPIVKEDPTRLSHFITEQMVLAPNMLLPLKPLVKIQEVKDVPLPQPILPEEPKVVDHNQISVLLTEPITDLTSIKSYDDFNRLSHLLKIRWIKESTNMELLKDIAGKTTSAQFKNNINFRLTQIKV
jgi:hypothetical protein